MTFELIKTLCECGGIPGREAPVRDKLKELLSDFKCETDALGNLLVTVCEPRKGGISLLFEAHLDRIGLMVGEVGDDGFVRVVKSGGIDRNCIMGTQIEIAAKDGMITGAVGAPFPYPAKPHNSAPASEYKLPEIDELFVDTGLSDAKSVIKPGMACYIKAEALKLLDGRVSAPGLDDRAGCAALVLAAFEVKEQATDNGVKLLFSSREETGGQGAKTGAFDSRADMAVAVDVGFAISPDVKAKDGVIMGKGPEIDSSSVLDERLTDALISAAKSGGIPYQELVLPARATGTDADDLTVVASGMRTALLSIPVRFMHHPSETADLADIENTAKLLARFAREVNTDV
ncbi:MAG: M20/M25/M40 family metallo-hydrolase [Oscillospiraceae bacterium]